MPTYHRTRNALLLAKAEVTEGTDPTPTAGSNAMRVENVQWSEVPNVIQSNEVSAALDMEPPLVGGVRSSVSFDVWVKTRAAGSTVPDHGILLRMCGMTETATGTAVPSSPEALASGSSPTQCTLGASAAGTLSLYNGMPINFTSTVTGLSAIASYSAAKLAVLTDTLSGNLTTSTNYQIPLNVVYRFASSSLASGTLWFYVDGLLFKMTGARGTVTGPTFVAGEGIKYSFSFQGIWVQATDTSVASPTFNDLTKLVWRGTSSGNSRSRWNRLLAQCKTLSFDAGNTVMLPDNPEATEGYDAAQITMRAARFTMDPYKTLLATRNMFDDMRQNTARILHARSYTGSAGGGFMVTAANAQVDQNTLGDRDGLATEQVSGRCTGNNDAFSICYF